MKISFVCNSLNNAIIIKFKKSVFVAHIFRSLSFIFAYNEPKNGTLQDRNLNLKIYIRYLKTNYYIKRRSMLESKGAISPAMHGKSDIPGGFMSIRLNNEQMIHLEL